LPSQFKPFKTIESQNVLAGCIENFMLLVFFKKQDKMLIFGNQISVRSYNTTWHSVAQSQQEKKNLGKSVKSAKTPG
jgi:hypothetical protein